MKSLIVVFISFISFTAFACDCPLIQKIDAESLKKYNVVFYGVVDSVSSCNTEGLSIAYFTIEELYKGETEKNIKITFDCSSSCMMSFAKGEKWIIYAVYKKFEVLAAHFCEHTRKYYSDEKQDAYAFTISQQTFEQEKKYLITNLGIQAFVEKNKLNEQQSLLKPHNDQPSGLNKILLLIVSFVVMIIVFLVSRKKKNNKQ